ncbi:MAG TPA: thiamine phosphate synthase [Polyangiaceae bacterium]|jgi:thiamine-phosphate pyrophosphorylase|nr:thiamine phosphate synthase [Polyangiaceae bacterium]
MNSEVSKASAVRLLFFTDIANRGWEATLDAARVLASSARPGSVAIVLREPDREARLLYREACALLQAVLPWGQLVLVRERLDVALAARAHGVHLAEQSVFAADLVALPVTRGLWLTRAWHAVNAPCSDTEANALVISPIMSARKGVSALGPDGVKVALSHSGSRPVYALGGIDANNARQVLSLGVAGVAVQGAAYAEPAELVRALSTP